MEIVEIINKIDLKGKDKLITYLEKIQKFNEKESKVRHSDLSYEEETRILQDEIYPEKNKIYNKMMREVINGNIELLNTDNPDYNINIYCSTNYMGIELYTPDKENLGCFLQSYKFTCPVNALDEDIREDIAFKFSAALQDIDKEMLLNELTECILQTSKKLEETNRNCSYLDLCDLELPCYLNKIEPYDNIDATLWKEKDGSFTIKITVNECMSEEREGENGVYTDNYFHSEHSPYIKFTDEQQKMLENKFNKIELKDLPSSVSPEIETKTPETTR